MASPRTKYQEYKQKMSEWTRIFEEEYGAPPTDDDRMASKTWNALNDKATYYKKQLKEQSGASSPSISPDKSSRRSRRAGGGERERGERDSSTGSRRRGDSGRPPRANDSPDAGRSRRSRGSRRHAPGEAVEEEPEEAAAAGTGGTSAAATRGPPPLPEVDPALAEHPEVASLEYKAREAREKLLKWERAYEREQGEPPRAEDRAASNTYTSYEKKFDSYRAQLEALLAELAAGGGPSVMGAGTGGADGSVRKKRLAVSAEGGAASAEDGVPAQVALSVIPKDADAEAAIEEASKNCVLFSGLGTSEYRTVVDAMFEVKASAGQTLINEGEKGDNFYMAQSGSYAVFISKLPGKPVKTYAKGEAFGELALMYNCPRAATVKCTESGTLWALDRGTFRAILCSSQASEDHDLSSFLGGIPLLASLTQEQLTKLTSVVVTLKFNGGEYIVRQGERADSIFFIRQGRVLCQRRGSEDVLPVGEAECFGESALNEEVEEDDRVRKADVVSDGTSTIVQLNAAEFHKLLGSSLQEVAAANFNKKILSAVKFDGMSVGSILSSSDLNRLLEALSEETYKDGQTVFDEGANGDAYYIVKSGSAVVSTRMKGEVAVLTEGDYFGEMALVRAEPRSATISAQGPLKCLCLNRITFTRLLGPLQERLALEMERREHTIAAIRYSDLEIRQTIGVGSFGQVRLALHTPTQTPYALKSMFKGQIIAQNQVAHVMSEKQIMQRCNHPFLLRLAASYMDADNVYMLIELVQGGELFGLLRTQRYFQEPVAAFYAAIVVSAFEYLHDRSIVYRDLKPENLLLDAQGYLKVVDFGFAKEVRAKTWTLCGTPEYLAPEIILNKGHNHAADWWAVGILCYEMIMGNAPFVDDNDPMQIYQKALRGVLPVSKGQRALSKDSRNMIERLLVKEPTERLGCMKLGVSELKRHAFFSKTNWQRLEKKLTQAPYIPTIENPLDVSNFESEWEIPHNEHAALNSAATAHLFEGFDS